MTTDIHTVLGSNRMTIHQVDETNLARHTDVLVNRMDTFGIDRALLTPIDPNKGNELYLGAADIYPDRLFSACTLIPRPIETARIKLRNYVDRGCLALVLDEDLYYPQDPATHALLRTAIQEDLVIYFRSCKLAETRSFIESSANVYPEAKFVILEMGGLFGFPNLIPLLSKPNIWLETSITLVKLVESPLRVFLDALIQDMGVSKLVLGSGHHTEYPDMQAALNMIDLNYEQNRIMTKENAWVILGLRFS